MKRYLLALLNLFICGIITILLLLPISELLMPKRIIGDDNNQRLSTKGFYGEPNNSIDVLFLGDSNLYRGISPIVLWDNYGISSYVYGSPNQKSFLSYYLLKDALETQNPKIVVLNVETAFNNNKIRSGSVAKAFDDMENLKIKLEVLFNNDIETPIVERLAYIFKVFRYHDRYKELNSDDFKYFYKDIHYPLKGFDVSEKIVPAENNTLSYMSRKNNNKINPNCKKYLDKIVDLCKNKNIELILVQVPSRYSWTYDRSDEAKKYANSKNVKFIDLNLENIGINWYTDTKDKGNHLNLYGATKTSEYFGKILSMDSKYINRKNDSNYKYWYEDSRAYHERVDKYLKEYNENINKKNK